jgi:hypothetical protein
MTDCHHLTMTIIQRFVGGKLMPFWVCDTCGKTYKKIRRELIELTKEEKDAIIV